MRKKHLVLALLLPALLAGCKEKTLSESTAASETHSVSQQEEESSATPLWGKEDALAETVASKPAEANYNLIIQPYNGKPSVEYHGNKPFFTEEELTTEAFETYSELDEFGRCGPAYACIGPELMPDEDRGEIGEVKPTGWHTVKYDGIEGNYLYNRCHLIAYQLTGENDNEKNLITGTRYLNTDGMLPYETKVIRYVEETGNHVLYRVSPYFTSDHLLADGVFIEAQSVEDDEICFCVFCYNVQPGITINYMDGESQGPEFTGTETHEGGTEKDEIPGEVTYVGNKSSLKLHLPTCDGAKEMAEYNRTYFYGDKQEALKAGYEPCGSCKP